MSGIRFAAAVALVALSIGAGPAQRGSSHLFSSSDVLAFRLTAPFNQLFATADDDSNLAVTGTVTYGPAGRETNIEGVKVSLRGHTSREGRECTFPKLKLQIPADHLAADSPFAGTSVVKIGTHCGESSDDTITAEYGRLPNERAAHREAFVYRLLDIFGVATLEARPARISYIYADARPSQTPDQRQPIVRDAFLLEDTDEAVKRLGGKSQVGEDTFTNARDRFAPSDTATVTFAEAMLGNFDWCLRMTPQDTYRCNGRHPLWNVLAVVDASGRARPLIYDFDVTGMVAGGHRWFADVYNEAFLPSHSHPAIEVLGQIERTRSLFGRGDLNAVRARFMEKKSAAYAALAAAAIDPAGKRRIQEYLDGFFDAIGSDEAFYRPVVVARGSMPYATASRSDVVCTDKGAIPVGTVVTDALQQTNRMIQVVVLDSLWHWGPPTKCAAIHAGAVWIDSNTVSRDYPPEGNSSR